MRLVSVTIEGFKSFADKTSIEFPDGITCVIGENGNGKTCIQEAIVWALGSQSSSALRAVRDIGMGSLIFWGNATRPMSKFAEVSVVFSNEDRALPIDTSEVEIRRRLSVTGWRSKEDFDTQAEYFINRKPCRLKDINDLLANTGVGRNSYSVLRQGEIDAILKAKPVDRRAIFEEAASISSARQDEKEANARLAAAEANLKEVQIRFSDLQRQHTRLKNQAEAAIGYSNDKKELQNLENKQAVMELEASEKRKADCQKRLEKDLSRLESLESRTRQMDAKRKESEQELSELRESIGILKSRIETAVASKGDKERTSAELSESGKALAESLEEVRAREREAERVSGELEKEIAALGKSLDKNRKEMSGADERIAKEQELSDAESDRIRELETADGEKSAEKNELETELFALYGRFISSAHDVIAIVNKQLGDKKGAKSRKAAQEKIIARIGELQALLARSGPLAGEELDEARTVADDIRRLFEEYKSLGIDFTKLEGDALSIEEATRADEAVSPIFDRIGGLDKEIAGIRKKLAQSSQNRSLVQFRISSLAANRQKLNEERIGLESRIEAKGEALRSNESRKAEIARDLKAAEKSLEANVSGLKSIEGEIGAMDKEIAKMGKELAENEKKREKVEQALIGMGGQTQVEMETLKESIATLRAQAESIEEIIAAKKTEYFEREGIEIGQIAQTMKIGAKDDIREIKSRIQELRARIKEYGNINYLAAEEFAEVSKQYDLMKKQLEDYTKAREDVKGVVEEMQRKNTSLFMDAFNTINSNFNAFYSTLSRGGTASIRLEQSEDALEAGIEVYACPPGKSATYVSSLSGGEKVMATIALFFAIYQTRPAPFCFLDEPVAALSEKNVAAFLEMLRDFKDTSQFIMITHDKYTLRGANALIGVTQAEKGVSKVVSCNMTVSESGEFLLTDRKTGRPVSISLD